MPAQIPSGPEQLGGDASGRDHEVPAEHSDANGGNALDAADLQTDNDALPLAGGTTPFTPVSPDIDPQELTDQTQEMVETTPAGEGFDPEQSQELVDERTRWTKEYENTDGTTTTLLYTDPVHARDENGTWQEIDTTLVPKTPAAGDPATGNEGDLLGMAVEETDLTLSTDGDAPELVTLGVTENGGHSLAFGLEEAAPVTGQAQDDTILYENVRPDADLELQAAPGMVKETIILNSADAPREWTFPLELNGLTPELDDQGAVVFSDTDGQAQAVIPTGWMEDSSFNEETGGPAMSGDVSYRVEEKDGDWSLVVVLDDTWLDDPDRVYPVQVDPSVADIDTNGDSYVQNDWPTTNYGGDDELKIGSYDGSTRAISYLRFGDVNSQLKNRYILNADLVLFNHWSANCSPRQMRVHQITESWSASTVTWNNRPSSSGTAVATDSFSHGESCSGAKWETVDLGKKGVDLVQDWVEGSVTNHGLSLQADFDNTNAWKRFGSRQSANQPYLAITHSEWGASYDVGSLTEPVTGGQGGEVSVTVTNLGSQDWEPQGWNEFRLGTRVRDKATGELLDAVAFTRLNERLTPNDSATLDARIPPLPPGEYLLNFDMQRLQDQRWLSSESVPVTTVTVTSQDVGPRINDIYPRPGAQVGSLTPTLFAEGESIDDWPADATVEYWFEVCADNDGEPGECVNSTWQDDRTWVVPEGTLAWGEQFLWRVRTREGTTASPISPYYPFVTAVEQPAITSHLGGVGLSGAGRDVDPLIGNHTLTDTDAEVAAVGPALGIQRTYNSRDPRTDNVFGAGWSTRFDMRVSPDDDGTGNVVVTYPHGQQVRFGQNPDGTYAPPFGSFATLTSTDGGGWRLTDKNQTGYVFDASGQVVEITDFRDRTQHLEYASDGTLASVTNPGGRTLHFTWENGRVASVSTEPPQTDAAPLTWTYTYEGERLVQVCGPEDTDGACTRYTYTDGSHYLTVVRDAGPVAYWRLGEAEGSTEADNDLLLDHDRHTGVYHDVQLGTGGALQGSPESAATFNGTSSHLRLSDWLVGQTPYLTVEMWFRTDAHGVLFSYQQQALDEAITGTATPALYVGTDGRLRGQFWNGTVAPITTDQAVNDGAWHHVALTAAGDRQSLYLDGAKVGGLTGAITQDDQRYVYAGAGSWSNWPGSEGDISHFTGDLDEIAVYNRPLGAQTVAEHHAAGTLSQKLTQATLPSGRVHTTIEHDTAHDRVRSYTDANGATYRLSDHTLTGANGTPTGDDEEVPETESTVTVKVTDPDDRTSSYTYDPLNGHRLISQTDVSGNTAAFAYDTGGFLAATTAPDGTVTRAGHDERGNKISQTTCRDASDPDSCSTSYYGFHLNADDPLDPRNDQLTVERDARSTGADDDTYATVHTYNAFGDRIATTTPATPDFPQGRETSQTFTDGTETAVGGGTVPAGLLLTSTDPRGAVTSREYYATGDLARVTAPNGLITEYTYDTLGREVSATVITDDHPEGITTTRNYDGDSRVTTETGPATVNAVTETSHQASVSYTYDPDGLPLTETVTDLGDTDQVRTTTRTYDDHGRLASVTDPEGQTETYTYDTYGNQHTRTMSGGDTFRYEYTPTGDLAEVVLTGYTGHPADPQPATDVVLDSYAYDPVGRTAEHTDAMGRTTRYTYYDDGLPAQEIRVGFREEDGSTRDIVLADRAYDAAGNLTRESTGNGTVTTTYTVDAANRITALVLDPDGLARRTTYTYDAGGEVLTETRTGAGGTRTETSTYERDITGAWTSHTIENGDQDLTLTRTLDQRGLALTETTPGGATVHHTYDALGRPVATQSPSVTIEEWSAEAVTGRPTTLVGYNAFGEATHEKDAQGQITRTSYDGAGRPVSVTLADYTPPGSSTALTPTLTTTYNTAGHIASETDPAGGVTTYTYDQLGNIATLTEPAPRQGEDAPVTTYTHDLLGEQLSVTDPTGARTEATYDDLGRQITLTQIERHSAPGAHTTRLAYDDAGNLTSTTTPSGTVATATFNAAAQPVTETDPAGLTTSYTYGPTGLAAAVTHPDGTTLRTTYDGAGRATATTAEDASGTTLATTSTRYDADSNPVAITDPLGHTTTQEYDLLGRLTTLTEPVDDTTSITTTFGYDAASNRTRLTDGRGNTTWYTFTTHGLLESVIEPATDAHPDLADRTWTTVYDVAGNPVEERQPGGVVQQRTFDALGRITQVSGSGAEAETQTDTFAYDLVGRPTRAGSATYTYDDRGNLLTAAGSSGEASFSYDIEGRMTQRTDAAGTTTFAYDDAGRVSAIGDPLTGVEHRYAYDSAGRLGTITYGADPAPQRSFTYDAQGRLLTDTTLTLGPVPTLSTAYTYDKAGQVTGRTTAGIAGEGEHTYTYDHAGRLTSWTAPDDTVTDYTWDAAGNRTSAGEDSAVYDERNRLISGAGTDYSWTARGTLAETTDVDGTVTAFTHDARGRMITDGDTTYFYDGLNRLIQRGGDKILYADQANDPVSVAGELIARDLAGSPLSTSTGGSAGLVTIADQHGDVIAGLDPATGAITGSRTYAPFGEVTQEDGATGSLGYQGEFTDPETGRVNMHARWYDPATGGFASRDSWTLNPVPSVQANRYTYANGSPLNFTDPSGHWPDVIPDKYTDHIDEELRRLSQKMERYLKRQARKAAARAAAAAGVAAGVKAAVVGGLAGLIVVLTPGTLADGTCRNLCYGNKDFPGLGYGGKGFCRSCYGNKPTWVPNPSGGGYYYWDGNGGGFVVAAPPPPPPWKAILAAVLATAYERPTTEATTDSGHDQFVDDSFTRAVKDLGLNEKQLKDYFKHFPIILTDADRRREFSDLLGGWDEQPGNCLQGNESWVYYHPLDSQGRATGVTACLSADQIDYRGRGRKKDPNKSTEIIGGDTDRGRGSEKTNPAGWQHLDGERGFARGHLLARELGGTGRDRRNLVKMYTAANSGVMAQYEHVVRRRLDAGERVFYVSVPNYEGNNPVPETIDLYAVGDRGFYAQWTVYNTPTGMP
ncbi:DNRLRE domain-containing protein [Nocardiopsis changdeensis]|uniref:DNRLRE domain-containing protein n=1 Tax=Nocardiopsis changdeensis TaxID=2831969 RepID=A0ABX8BJQ2_9ACTN|nr:MULTISPECIES: DNRLRE domain-containing protein [Nocardiopsis]QUX22472.1 DNRLRE domain-containing protein [Nocardiopsis changdeensis]QYX38414.1 DNRLRE domain-containing protein [Nocardiopsis sp. MT53]